LAGRCASGLRYAWDASRPIVIGSGWGTYAEHLTRQANRRGVGTARDGPPGGPHRRRFAEPESFRRGPGRLHVRNAVLDVRHYLSVCDVAPPTADAHVLATRLVGVSDPAFHRFQPSRGPAPVLLAFAANRFIFRRGRMRGLAHWLMMWGCVLAAAMT